MKDNTILDSSLILATQKENSYNIKVIDCGDYIQLYSYESKKFKKESKEKEKKLIKEKIESINELKEIELKNINRSKFICQRLAKCNSKNWKTFITLTFAENITNIKEANYEYKKFSTKVKRVFKNFMCLGVPEFQKRGAVHYHLLTNISINNNDLIFKQQDNEKYYHIKYWKNGFDKVDNVDGNMQKICGYISKYMTKDIDDRLWGHHRYFYTKNLKRPIISYIDLTKEKHINFLNNLLKEKELIYNSNYIDNYTKEKIAFCEFLKTNIHNKN